MRILPLFTDKFYSNIQKNDSVNALKTNNVAPKFMTNLAPLAVDTVSFGRTAKNAEALRALMSYGIPDMYSGKIVIDPKLLERLYSKQFLGKPIRAIVRILSPYEDSFHNIEKQFFDIVKKYAEITPEYTLPDIVKRIAPEYNKQLLIEQKPIFNSLINMANDMPIQQQEEFNTLMDIVNKKISREPISLPFSSKEFQYKLQRIVDELKHKHHFEEANIVLRMIKIAKRIPERPINSQSHNKAFLSKVRRRHKLKMDKSLLRTQSDLLTEIEIMAAGTPLKNNQDLIKLLSQTRSKIYNIPIITPFNRKSFIYELKKITDTLENTKLAHKIIQKATKLPTSHDSLAAFIMKCVEYSSDKIVYNLISGSGGSIDHLVPFIKKGRDCIENYGISSSYYNSERAERSMEQQLKKYPETYINCQKQVDRLIELYNQGIFKKIKLPKSYITSFAKRMYNLSPEDNRLVLDLSKLK